MFEDHIVVPPSLRRNVLTNLHAAHQGTSSMEAYARAIVFWLSNDGRPEFTAGHTRDFLTRWGVEHRISFTYNPRSNGRVEVAVKATKRLLRSNVGPTGSLDDDRFLCALLQQRNTPDSDCDISPAQVIFGKPIRDSLSFVNRLKKYSNPHVRFTWCEAWSE